MIEQKKKSLKNPNSLRIVISINIKKNVSSCSSGRPLFRNQFPRPKTEVYKAYISVILYFTMKLRGKKLR